MPVVHEGRGLGHTRRAALAMLIVVPLSSCGGAGALKLLAGGGPNVAANAQAGKTNSQTIGETEIKDQRIRQTTARDINQSSDENKVKAARDETVVVQEVPSWLIRAFAVALFLDSPLAWPGQIATGLKRVRSHGGWINGSGCKFEWRRGWKIVKAGGGWVIATVAISSLVSAAVAAGFGYRLSGQQEKCGR